MLDLLYQKLNPLITTIGNVTTFLKKCGRLKEKCQKMTLLNILQNFAI